MVMNSDSSEIPGVPASKSSSRVSSERALKTKSMFGTYSFGNTASLTLLPS